MLYLRLGTGHPTYLQCAPSSSSSPARHTRKHPFLHFSTFLSMNHSEWFFFTFVATHLEHLQLVPNLLKIFGTPSSVFVQLG